MKEISNIFDQTKSYDFNDFRLNHMLYDSYIQFLCADKYEDYFGTWVTNIWTGPTTLTLHYKFKNITFQDQKEIFFRTFQRLLEEGKIIVTTHFLEASIVFENGKYVQHVDKSIDYNKEKKMFPKDPRYTYWDRSPQEIVDYIRSVFPKEATHLDDQVLQAWFYGKCPLIGWVDQETGEVTAS